jgi:hypothetical protein
MVEIPTVAFPLAEDDAYDLEMSPSVEAALLLELSVFTLPPEVPF